MKKHRHKLHRVITSLFTLALCGVLALEGPGFTVFAQELPGSMGQELNAPRPGSETESVSSQVPGLGQGLPEEEPFEGDLPENQNQEGSFSEGDTQTTEEPSQPEVNPDIDETPGEEDPSQPEEPEEPEEPQPARYTITYQMGSFGTITLEMEEGQLPSLVPSIPDLPAAVTLGWFDKDGNSVDPATTPVTGDVTYTARWSREVGDLLNTEEHVAYMSGYNTGLFLPNKSVTRAEAVTMFYKLLLTTDWEKKSFPDVPADQWYAEAVETMAGLGVVSGYENGTFGPNKKITRAEFVTIAMAFSTLENGKSTFSDVPDSFWAAPYIYSASQQGWVSGYEDGTFGPNKNITRAEAVSIINKMLGRTADPNVKELTDVKNYYDLFPTHWAYAAIVEASTPHTYHMEGGEEGQEGEGQEDGEEVTNAVEVWDTYEKDTTTVESHWIRDGGNLYYVDGSTRKVVRGKTTINGVTYIFDSSTGAAYNGFYMDGQWRRYYKDGSLVNDISGLGVVSGPYYIKVYKPANYLIIYAKDPATGKYNTPVRSMLVCCGVSTPTGTYYTPARYRWLKMVGDTWAQWCTQIQGNYLFHSVPNWTHNNFDLEVGEYNLLGSTRSLGCIRLNCEDAKWIYDNCQLGTQVFISAIETSGPLAKPTGIQLPSWHTWDPTDPTAYYACQKRGCH
jgi:hypothetical protein